MQTPTELVQKAQISFYSQTIIATLNYQIHTLVQASYSVVLTLANYLLFHHPNLAPPNAQTKIFYNQQKDTKYPQMHLTHNKLYQPWCDYLSELLFNNQAHQVEQILHLFSKVSEMFIHQLDSSIFNFKDHTFDMKDAMLQAECNIIELIYPLKEKKTQNVKTYKKVGIVNFSTSQLREDKLQPKMHLPGLFAGVFYNQGDQWYIYNVLSNQYPTQQEYKQLDTLILSGSSLCVNDNDLRVNKFADQLKQALKQNKQLKVLGICFGHQLLAKMYGGAVVKKNLLTGVETITFDQKILQKVRYFQRTQLDKNQFSLSEYHSDFVEQMPQNFHVLAQSQKCKMEALISNNGRLLSFQFHPQYSAQYIKAFEARACQYSKHHKVQSCYHKQKGGIQHDQSLLIIRKVIRNFINWKAEELDLSR